MGDGSSNTATKVLKDVEAIEFMLDNMDAINSEFGPYDKNKFFYRVGDKSWGNLPDEARKIIMVTRAPIDTKDIMAYLKDGSRGVLIAHKGEDETGKLTAIHFDLATNTFAILEDMLNKLHKDEQFQKALYTGFSKRWDIREDDPEIDEKLQNVMSGWMERVGETEPEIRQIMEGYMN